MSEKKPKTYESEVRIAASPDAVWKAIAEAEGIKSWFVPEAKVTPGQGGSVWASWGPGMEGTSRIEIWEPGKRLQTAHDKPGGGQSVVDWTITTEGGECVLRLVQSGFNAEADFDAEYESTSRAWPVFLKLLKHGAEHPYQRVTNVTIFRMLPVDRTAAWEKMKDRPELAKGVVKHDEPGYRCLVIPEENNSVVGIFCESCGGSGMLTIMAILYDTTPEHEAATRTKWAEMTDELFGAAPTA